MVFNPEPTSDFIDAYLIGDGEEAVPELVAKHRELKRSGMRREEIIKTLAQLQGWYAPALYDAVRDPISNLLVAQKSDRAPYPIKRRILLNLSQFPFPTHPVVPHTEIVHDRFSYEIMRGCNAGCRFCQAGYIYRPVRERSPERLMGLAQDAVCSTGYDEVSLSSLSASPGSRSPAPPLQRPGTGASRRRSPGLWPRRSRWTAQRPQAGAPPAGRRIEAIRHRTGPCPSLRD